MELKENMYQTNGKITYGYSHKSGIDKVTVDNTPKEIEEYSIFPMKEFLSMVRRGYITDYDGCIANIFVDGYDTNLGLNYMDINEGSIPLTPKQFKSYLKDSVVVVNWANK